MIKDDRRLWKLLLFTIPTFGIYNIYFWFRFTQDLNEMNREEKRIKNYILVWFLSIITLGIYRWVWLFYIEDRIQMTGKQLGMKILPGPGTTLGLWTFGKFILVGPFLADYFIIRNMNRVAKEYNASVSKKTKVVSTTAEDHKQAAPKQPVAKPNAPKSAPSASKQPAAKPNAPKSASSASKQPAAKTNAPKSASSASKQPAAKPNAPKSAPSASKQPAAKQKPSNPSGMNQATKVSPEKKKVVNKQVITPEKKSVSKEAAATKESPAPKKNPSTVTLDVEKNRPRANDATLQVNPGADMPMGTFRSDK